MKQINNLVREQAISEYQLLDAAHENVAFKTQFSVFKSQVAGTENIGCYSDTLLQ